MPPSTTSRRRFKSIYWDQPPEGFEHVTVRKYKEMQAAGQVPQSVVNPSSSHLHGTKYARPKLSDPMEAVRAAAAIINSTLSIKPSGRSAISAATPVGPALTRQARRLYIGNIPFGCTDDELIEFFRSNMEMCNFIQEPGNPVLACQINLVKNFAFLEFRTIEETTSAVALDGILCKGQALKIRRPHDYQPVQRASVASKGDGGSAGPGSGSAPLGGGGLTSGFMGSAGTQPLVQIQVPGLPNLATAASGVPRALTEILCLMNMVDPEELRDDDEFSDIIEDILDECKKYGRVMSIEIPRPLKDGSHTVPGLGKVFVEFDSVTEAQRAQANLAGRRFANRIVVTSYFDGERYRNREF